MGGQEEVTYITPKSANPGASSPRSFTKVLNFFKPKSKK